MEIQLKYIEEKCKPEGNASGLFLVVNDICLDESKSGKIIKVKDVLGTITNSIKNPETGAVATITRDKIYYLDTLYRCVVDTGVEVPDMSDITLTVQPLTSLAIQFGIQVLPCIYPIVKGDKKYIGLVVVNLATYKFPIKKYDKIARLIINKKSDITICHTEEIQQSEQQSN